MSAQMRQLKRNNALASQHFAQLTAMVNVVRHDPPEGPLLRDRKVLSLIGMTIGLAQVLHRPLV